MIDVTVHQDIARAPADVFAFATDPARLPDWQTNTVSVTQEGGDGPLAVGTRLREVHRGPRGRELASLVEVAELEPDRLLALRMLEGPLPVHGRIAMEPTAGGTHVAFTAQAEPRGALRLAGPLLRVALRRQFAAHLATLKQVLEAPS